MLQNNQRTSLFNEGEKSIFSITGNLDQNSVPQYWANRSDIINNDYKNIFLDLSSVSHCDSAGLALLIQLQNEMSTVNKSITISNPTDQISRLIKLSHLEDILNIS